MSVTPLIEPVPVPERGGIVVGSDVAGRVLRVNGHPDAGRVVLSIWQGPRCVATVRLTPDDVPELTAALVRAAVFPPPWTEPPAGAAVTALPAPRDDSLAAVARRGWQQVRRLLG